MRLGAATELEQRIVRGRQIVARQRELAAEMGNAFPVAVMLLATCEKSLALLEHSYRQSVPDGTVNKAIPQLSGFLVALPSPAEAAASELNYQDRMRHVARIMEILGEGGYHCRLEKPLH